MDYPSVYHRQLNESAVSVHENFFFKLIDGRKDDSDIFGNVCDGQYDYRCCS